MAIVSSHRTEAPKVSLGEGKGDVEVALLTGGQDLSYAYGLATTLGRLGTRVHVIGVERVDHVAFHTSDRLIFVDLGGVRPEANVMAKLFQLTLYYLRLLAYVTFRSPAIIHILWNSKFEYFDRTLLTLYFRLLGKRVVLTAHNINKAKRDSCDSLFNRVTLKIQYSLADRVFVHTEKMKAEMVREFGTPRGRVEVVPFGINILVPDTELTTSEARRRLGIRADERTILFYGRIVPYKGLECLVDAFQRLSKSDASVRLIIAGQPMKGYEAYVDRIRQAIDNEETSCRVLCRWEFIPDDETELYFKSADVLVLPYKSIFESGVLYLAYRFGVPVIASDVESFAEELAKGSAGLVFEPGNSIALGDTLVKFFEEEFYKDAANHRRRIQEYSRNHHSWEIVAQITEGVYRGLIKPSSTTESVKVATACKVREGSRPGARENADGPTIEKAETW